MKNDILQLIIAAILSLAGIALLFYGAAVEPTGQIHESVLIAFGEVATFAGSIIGIDYKYRKTYERNSEPQKEPER